MRILDKYIIKNFLTPFLYCLSLFIFLYMIIDLFGHLDDMLKNAVPVLMIQEYYLSMIPFIVIYTAPIAALISTIYVISAMNKHDELTAMRSAGVSVFRILAPFMFLGFMISVSVFFVSEKLLPVGMKNALYIREHYMEKNYEDEAKNKNIITNIALYGKDNRLIFIKSYDRGNNIVSGITILKQDPDGNVMEKINAGEGKWTGSAWLFSDILIYEFGKQDMATGNVVFFETKTMDMENPRELMSKGTNYEFMNFKDLAGYIRNFSAASPEVIHRLQVDLHQKLSLPFTSLVVMLIGSGIAVKVSPRKKAHALVGMGMSIIIAFAYYALMATFTAMGKGGILPPALSAHLANIIFGLTGLMLIKN